MKLTTTLALLRQNNACERGYNLISNHVGRDFAGQIDLLTILEVNGLDDCLWAFRATEQEEGRLVAVAFAIYCAEPYCADEAWRTWATNWMNGSDRSQKAAEAAEEAGMRAEWAAVEAARAAAVEAAWAAVARAVRAAREARWAARLADENSRQLAILRRLLSDDTGAAK